MAVSKIWVLCVGVLGIGALLFGVCSRASDFGNSQIAPTQTLHLVVASKQRAPRPFCLSFLSEAVNPFIEPLDSPDLNDSSDPGMNLLDPRNYQPCKPPHAPSEPPFQHTSTSNKTTGPGLYMHLTNLVLIKHLHTPKQNTPRKKDPLVDAMNIYVHRLCLFFLKKDTYTAKQKQSQNTKR